jgi:hypothetical protein
MMDRLTRVPIPNHRRLALVGNADCRKIAAGQAPARSASAMTACVFSQISVASCSTHPGRG